MKDDHRKMIFLTGVIGLVGAILVGAGEFFLHYDPLARFSENSYDFMLAVSDERQTTGHFLGVLAGPLYLVGCWHIYLMLRPANQKLAFIGFILSAYGFMMGINWIGSRSFIGALIHRPEIGESITGLTALYQIRYESLLSIVRGTTVTISFIFIYLTLTGRSHYQKWHAIFNPILLLLISFALYGINPAVGKYVMPIALNVAFAIFFIMSLIQTRKI